MYLNSIPWRKTTLAAVMLICTATFLSCSKSELDRKLLELRTTIENSQIYVDAFDSRVASLKDELVHAENDSLKAELAFSLFKEYEHFNTDSAKVYINLIIELPDIGIPKDMLKAWEYSIDGDAGKLKKIFRQFDMDTVPHEYRNDCYNFLVCAYQFVIGNDGELYDFMSKAALDPAIATDLKEMFLGTVSRGQGEQLYAREHYMNAYKASSSTHMQSRTAFLVALTFNATGNNDKYEYWLAQSAIHDLNVPVKSYSAMQNLAMAEMERGQYKSASDMVKVFMNDAIESKYWIRVTSAIEYEQAIIAAVNKAEKKSMVALGVSALLMLVFSVLLLKFLLKSIRQRKMLAKANAAIEEMSKEKEEYIHKYMKLSLNYLGSVEQYRHKLRLLMKSEGKDAVIAQLRGPSETESEYSDFYKEFDETFLKIYPDFVAKVNTLLKPEARFENEHAMNLPLRVLAAIKLGITESKEIASFLNCAPASVYTYRSKLKANALGNKEDFESEVCRAS